ncbi:MAG: flagellar export chaperone FlgN [Lachnotalea sp.]
MEQDANYILIMIDSLQKKVSILNGIITVNNQQAEIIVDIKKNMVEYEVTIDNKQLLIDELNLLDNGFEALYERVQAEIFSNSLEHVDQIKEMQSLIAAITDKSVEVQAGEEKNRQVIAQQFSLLKREVKNFKDNRNVVNTYYKTMQKLNYITPQFMDKKK